MQRKLVLCALFALLALAVGVTADNPAWAGGPVILMGIDAEDGGPGGHGPISVYESVITTGILPNVTNGGSGILVIGGGKGGFDDVSAFWNQIAADTGVPVTYVNGAANITAQSFAGFKMIAVVSDANNTFWGGLTQAENDALATRQVDVAAFVNGGGGLLGFSSNFTNPYAYLAGVGAFTFNHPPQYSNITATPAGNAVGLNDTNLDVCCWHDEYLTFPSFLQVLAVNAATGNAAALGGSQVTVTPLSGHMTGGGSIGNSDVRHGFTLHCDVKQLPNRLEVNWGNGNRFHLETLDTAKCSDDETIEPGQGADFDTFEGTGTGRYNGVSGATIEFRFSDAGEPGKNDEAWILIKDAGNNVVLNVLGKLNSGNHQAHK